METIAPEQRYAQQGGINHKLLDYVSERSPACRCKLARAGVDPRDIVDFEDLPCMSLTRLVEIIQSLKAEPPFAGLFCLRPEEIRTVLVSPGPMFNPIVDYEAERRLRIRRISVARASHPIKEGPGRSCQSLF